MRALIRHVSFWVALFWGAGTALMIGHNSRGPQPASPDGRWVALALMPEENGWRMLEWSVKHGPPVVPRQARLLPAGEDQLLGAGLLDTFRVEGAATVTVSQGLLQRESFRYQVDDSRLQAREYQSAPTLLNWLLAGLVSLMFASILAEFLARRPGPVRMAHTGLAFLVPQQWQHELYGTETAVRAALSAVGWIKGGRLVFPGEARSDTPHVKVRLVQLPARCTPGPHIRWAKRLGWSAVAGWLLTSLLAGADRIFIVLLPVSLVLGLAGIVLWVIGTRRPAPDGRPWNARPWQLVVEAYPPRQWLWAWHGALAVLPAATLWCLAGLVMLGVGALDAPRIAGETAIVALVALSAAVAFLKGVRQGRSAVIPDSLGTQIQALLASIPPADEVRRAKPHGLPNFAETAVILLIIGIVYAVVKPQYSSYVHQASVSESLEAAKVVTQPLAQHFARHGRWPAAWSELDPPQAAPLEAGRRVKLQPGTEGVVELHFPADYGPPKLNGAVLLLVPERDAAGQLRWTPCRGLGLPVRYRPLYCR